jgi:hypothetical protein
MRVVVDGSQHPIHDDSPSLGAVATDPDGHLVEVQVADLGDGSLNIIVSGLTAVDRDHRGNLRIHVVSTATVLPADKRLWPRRVGSLPPPATPAKEKP